ncbi:hypothetical protein BGX27_000705, partial [Mortierella sp. AM989]
MCAKNGKVLFILDGLDEVLIDTQHEKYTTLKWLLEDLLQQNRVIITSRPSGVDMSILPTLDLELETIGFNTQNISDYVSNVLNKESAMAVQDFIQKSLLIQGLVNIPIQLDVICYIWDSLPSNDSEVSMTGLYQTLVRKLWCKDGLRLRKQDSGVAVSAQQYKGLQGYQIDEIMAVEAEYLSYLAFTGMKDSHRIEFDFSALGDAVEKLDSHRQNNSIPKLLPFNLFETLKQTSFFHSADAGLDDEKDDSQRSWHFLHLTFQEYFAASWLVRHLQPSQWDLKKKSKPMMTKDEARAFIQDHKYDPRFEIVLWMVAGQLKGEPLESFFTLLQEAPRDLIGGRHQKLLAGCLKESRAQLNAEMVANFEAELMQWLHFDMTLYGDVITLWNFGRESILGKQWVIPEELLFKCFNQSKESMNYALRALESRPYLASSYVNDLIPYLDHVDEDIRMSTISVLAVQHILDNSVIEALVSILTDQSAKPKIKQEAARALSTQRSLPEIAFVALYDTLDDLNDDTLCSAARSLGKLVTLCDDQATLIDPIISAFIATINGGCWNARISAIEGLGTQPKLPEVVALSIISVMRDRDWTIKSVAASALSSYRSLPESAISALTNALDDEDLEFSCSAARVLGSQVTLSESTILVLVDALCHKEWSVRKSAAEALGTQSTLSEYAVQALIAATGDGKDHAIKGLAVKALCYQTIPSKDIIDAIYNAMQAQEPLSTTPFILRQPERTISQMIGILHNNNSRAIKGALYILSSSSLLPESAISALIAASSNQDWKVRKSAAETLGSQSVLPESAIMTLIKAFKDKVSCVRKSAVEAIGNQSILSESAVIPLFRTIDDGDLRVVNSVTRVLYAHYEVAEFDILALVIALYDKGQSQSTKRSAINVLGIQIGLSESSIHALNSALGSDSDVRRLAANELSTESQLHEITIRAILDVLSDKGSLGKAKGVQLTFSESTMLSLNSALSSNLLGLKGPVPKVPDAPQSLSEIAILNLIGNLHNSNWHVKKSASTILGDQVLLLESAIQALVDTLQNKDWSVKKSAAEILGTQSPLPEYAIMALIRATQDTSRSVRRAAVEAIGSQDILPESTIVALLGTLYDHDLGVVDSAARVLDAHYAALENTYIASTATLNSEGKAVKKLGTYKHNQFEVLRSWRGDSSYLLELGFNNDNLPTITEAIYDHSWSANIPSLGPMTAVVQKNFEAATNPSILRVLRKHGKDIKAIVAESLVSRTTLPEPLEEILISVLHSDPYSDGRITETHSMFQFPKSVTSTLFSKLGKSYGEEAADVLCSQSNLDRSTILYIANLLYGGGWKTLQRTTRLLETQTISSQTILSESYVMALVAALQDKDLSVKIAAAESLSACSLLPGCAISALLVALQDSNVIFQKAVAKAICSQSPLPESVILNLVSISRHWPSEVYKVVEMALENQPALSESTNLILAEYLTQPLSYLYPPYLAISALHCQDSLSEPVVLVLIEALGRAHRIRVGSILRVQRTLSESTIHAIMSYLLSIQCTDDSENPWGESERGMLDRHLHSIFE